MARVLLVDDEDAVREMLCAMLTAKEHEIVDYDSAKDAWDYLTNNCSSIDVIMTDMQMPVMTGREFIRLIRSDHRFDGIPVILSSGTCSVTEARDLLALEDVSFLPKPASLRELFAAVDKAQVPVK